MSRNILCLPKTDKTHDGENWAPPEDLGEMLSCCVWHEKDDAETNEDYLQIIPYVVLQNPDGNILTYPRGGNEERLHNLYSIGVGGHVEESDTEGMPDNVMTHQMYAFMQCVVRETREEVGIQGCPFKMLKGYLILNNTPVERVHMGVVFTAIVDSDDPQESEEIPSWSWEHPIDIIQTFEQYEGWAQEVLNQHLVLGNRGGQHACKRGGCGCR